MFNGAIGGALNAPTVTVAPVVPRLPLAPPVGLTLLSLQFPRTRAASTRPSWARAPGGGSLPRAAIRTQFPTLTQCTGAGNSNFRARGNPSDAAMFAANRRHEDHHGTDRQAAFNGSVVPWDARLTAARAAGTTFHGATAAAARAALFAAMGGTTAQVNNAFISRLRTRPYPFFTPRQPVAPSGRRPIPRPQRTVRGPLPDSLTLRDQDNAAHSSH